MTIITFVAAGAILDSASGAAQTLAYPAGIVANDTLVVLGATKNSANTAQTPSSTLTWAQRAAQGVFHKAWTSLYDGVATAPTIAVGGAACAYRMLAFRGVDRVNPVAGTASNVTAIQVDMVYPANTVAMNGCALITFSKDNGSVASAAVSANFTEVWDATASSGMNLQAQYWIQTTATNLSQTNIIVTPGTGGAQTQTGIAFALAPATGNNGLINAEIVNQIVNPAGIVQ